MNVLIVCSLTKGSLSPFISEQTNSISMHNINIDFIFILKKGIIGYIKGYIDLRKKIKTGNYDIIHAHYGLCGFISVFQFKLPVVTTFHGSDVNETFIRPFSIIAHLFSEHSIFVSKNLQHLMLKKKSSSIIPCGVNIDVFKPFNSVDTNSKETEVQNEKFVLFSSSFDNKIKNSDLAKNVISQLKNLELYELKNKEREEVNQLLNACKFMILTSFSEGSPQIIKEAMACNCPIVSVDVGDIKERLLNVSSCFVTDFNPQNLVEIAKKLVDNNIRTNGRDELIRQGLDLNSISIKIIEIYNKCVV